MRSAAPVGIALVLTFGCTPARYRGAEESHLAHGEVADAWSSEPIDAGTSVMHDAAIVTPEDAYVAPGHDAYVAIPDAWVSPTPDSGSTCPTFTATVAPLYAMHCGSCHTTGRDPHFGSSYAIANQSSSSCGTSMAACTIQLGRPGGSMARRDPYGGFSTADIAVIQSWIDCGRPM